MQNAGRWNVRRAPFYNSNVRVVNRDLPLIAAAVAAAESRKRDDQDLFCAMFHCNLKP